MPALWHDDDELFALARRELFTAVVGDVMDTLGFQQQFLPPEIRALRPDMVAIGRALTVVEADILPGDPPDQPFGRMFEALDDLRPNEIYLCSGSSPSYALWGGLMSTRARHLSAAGAVLNGFHRDTHEIIRLGFPVFSCGSYAQDQGPRGRVTDFRVPITVGAAVVNPGDIVFGDLDGVCVIPRAAEEAVFQAALEKVRGEQTVRQALQSGRSAVETFKQYGIM